MPAKVLLGVTGSIAAYKAAMLASEIVKDGHEIRVVMTDGASRFVSRLTFEALSGHPVPADIWDEQVDVSRIGHLGLARWADAIVIAPASANTLARLSLGLAGDLLGAIMLATEAPVLLAPAMETTMWDNMVTQEHLARLRSRGFQLVGPESGRLASGALGIGRMAEPETILHALSDALHKSTDLQDVRILVAAGPTHEAIDPVRYIGNRSSGKMGYAIAQQAAYWGAKVTLVSGPTSVTAPGHLAELVEVESSDQMRDAILSRCAVQDVVVMAAAVADFRPRETRDKKVKRSGAWMLELVPTDDIAAAAAAAAPLAIHIGFALESEKLLESAREKLERKGQSMVVANSITSEHDPFGSDTNQVALVFPDRVITLPEMPKMAVADHILDEVRNLLADKRPTIQH